MHLVTLEQLCACGLSARGARSRAATGRLHRLSRGVFCLHPPPYRREQLMLAAVLACGPGSCISDLSAAGHLRMTDSPPALIHVTNVSGAGRSLTGLSVHRRTIEPCDVLIRNGIRCTSPARTVVDCAASLDPSAVEDLLLAADASRILNRRRLGELLAERSGRPGTAKLRRLVSDDPIHTRSINERRMLRICRRFGVPEPLVNHPIAVGPRTFYADFCWPQARLIVEADSWRWHGGRLAGESDADRDQLLSLAGWRVVHFTRDQIHGSAERTGRRLLALTGAEQTWPAIGS